MSNDEIRITRGSKTSSIAVRIKSPEGQETSYEGSVFIQALELLASYGLFESQTDSLYFLSPHGRDLADKLPSLDTLFPQIRQNREVIDPASTDGK